MHAYTCQTPHLTQSEAVSALTEWRGGIDLISEMEFAMKARGLLPSSDNPKNTTYLKFEWQFMGISASQNVCDSSLYVLPVPCGNKLFIRYLEKGVYRGFTKKFLPVLLQKYNIEEKDSYLLNLYTDKDMHHESQLNKYATQTTRGFYQMMYHNNTSIGNLLTSNQNALKDLHALAYLQKKNTRPNKPMDK